MIDYPLILAQDDDIIKFIFGALFVLIWIAGAISSAHKKKQQEARQRQIQWEAERHRAAGTAQAPPPLPQVRKEPDWEEIYRDLTGTTVRESRSKPQVVRQAPPPLPQQQPKLMRKKDRRGPRRQAPPQPVAAPAPAIEVSGEGPTQMLVGSAFPTEERRASRPAAAALASKLDAHTLRPQFILTEILQPPLSLRDERRS